MKFTKGLWNAVRMHNLADKSKLLRRNDSLLDWYLGPARTSSSIQVETKVEKPDPPTGGFPTPDFRDTATIYRSKNWKQLWRSFIVFSLCSSDFIVNNQIKILTWTRRLLGLRMFRLLMGATIYSQFMAGETEEEVFAVAKNNAEFGFCPMFTCVTAEFHGDAKASAGITKDNVYSKNYHATQRALHMASRTKEFACMPPQVATKMTFLAEPDILSNFSTLLSQQEVILDNLLQGEDEQRTKQLLEYLSTVLDKSMTTYSGTGMVIPRISTQSDIHLQALVTNLPFNLELSRSKELCSFIQDSSLPICPLSGTDETCLLDLWQKLVILGQISTEEEVIFLMDAEQTYLLPATECLTLDLMRKYNTQRPTIHNTYQCYLKRTFDAILRHQELAHREGFCLGVKVVRGAYLDEERKLAANGTHEDPVNPSYDATTEMYERVASHLLQTIKELEPGRVHTTFATHNEDTVKYILNRINELGVSLEGKNFAFAQLLGMRDHISCALGNMDVPVAKLLNYGIIEDAVAFLSRRLLENRSGLATADLERNLVWTEIKRRLTG